jgi:hypothetical protein
MRVAYASKTQIVYRIHSRNQLHTTKRLLMSAPAPETA